MESPIIFTVCAFLMLMVFLTWGGYRIFYKPGKFLKQLGRPVITNDRKAVMVEETTEPESSNTIVTVLQQIGSKIPSSGAEAANLRSMLLRAGYRSEQAAPVFYGIRILTTLIMMGVTFLMMGKMPNQNPAMSVGLVLFGCALGWVLPRMKLEKQVKKRQETLRLSLPDALDLLVV